MFKRTIMFAAVAGLVLALAPAAQAAIPYTENMVGVVDPESAADNVLWGGWPGPMVGTSTTWGGTAPPDGDTWYARYYIGESPAFHMTTTENPILVADRGNLTFMVDWASQNNNGMKFIALVGGTWYGSDTFGTGADDHGIAGGGNVTEWEQDVSYLETGTWYASLVGMPMWYAWRDYIAWDHANPLTGLPAGDITEFGLGFRNTSNSAVWAADNFRVIPEPATMALLAFGGLGVLLRRRRR